jgi:hypothetical protein
MISKLHCSEESIRFNWSGPPIYRRRINRAAPFCFFLLPQADPSHQPSKEQQPKPNSARFRYPPLQIGRPNRPPRRPTNPHRRDPDARGSKQGSSGASATEWRNSPARTPESAALLSPIFLTMKLAPMKALDDTARARPLALSDDKPPNPAEEEGAAISSRAPTTLACLCTPPPAPPCPPTPPTWGAVGEESEAGGKSKAEEQSKNFKGRGACASGPSWKHLFVLMFYLVRSPNQLT